MMSTSNRNKNALYNSVSAAIYSIIVVFFGLILPRYIIEIYGSELNGLTSSIRQFVNYLDYIEIGMTPIFLVGLYKPLAEKDSETVSKVVSTAKRTYYKIGVFYFIGVVLGAIIYPLVLKLGAIDFMTATLLILVMGITGLLNIISLSKFRILLFSDQKNYVISILSSLSVIFDMVIQIILIKRNVNIVFVKIVPLISIVFRTLILDFYVKRNYPHINFNVKEKYKGEVRINDTLPNEISKLASLSIPLIALSIVQNLTATSIFSVYLLIFNGLQTIVASFTTGMTAAFGAMISEGDQEKINRVSRQFTLLLSIVLSTLYTTAIILAIPFLSMYLSKSPDINLYINPVYGVLFTFLMLIDNSRLSTQTTIQAAGKFKNVKIWNIIHIVTQVILSFVLGYYFSIVGVLVASIISSLIKLIGFYIVSEKVITPGNALFNIFSFISPLLIIFVAYAVVSNILDLSTIASIYGLVDTSLVKDIILFILTGIISVVISFVLSILGSLTYAKVELKNLTSRILNLFKGKKRIRKN